MIACSIERLQSALAGSLPVDDEADLCRHLDECEACGAEMERLAASDEVRAATITLLADDEWDADVPTRDDWSPADFTVEHLDPSDEPNVLGRLGGYDVLEIVGRGGMGVVLKAFDRDLKRCVAIKVLAPHLAQSSLARKRFAREARAAAAVVHPNVLAIHHVQPTGRLPFLVMPLVAGESLAHRIASQGTLSLEETLRIGMQAAAGLAAAHEQGLVHRDVKPANILLEKGVERAVLMDFGLARAADDVTLTRRGIISGTPQYMSPEQARGEPLDGRSDLFSLGCVLYEMATGVSPFRTDSMLATLRRLVDDAPRPLTSLNPELPGWFVAITDRLLEKDPARRFGSAKEVSELLEECLAHLQQPGTNPLPSTLSTTTTGSRRRLIGFRGVLTTLAALGACLFGGIVLITSEPDIAGTWSGDDWGAVVLKKTETGQYEGTYTDTFGKTPGAIRLSWSRIERRFNGTWREGDDRFGDLSVRLVGNEIRGAFTTDRKAKINPATPGLADLTWVRVKAAANRVGPVPPGIAIDEHGDVYSVNVGQASRPMVWGPVIERTIVGDGRDCWALNLATGKVVTSTPNQPLDFGGRAPHTLRAANVDLYLMKAPSRGKLVVPDTLVPLDMNVVEPGETEDAWHLSPSDVNGVFADLLKGPDLVVSPNMRAVNVVVDKHRIAGGLPKVGEYVDVLLTATIRQNGGLSKDTMAPFAAAAIIAPKLKIIVEREILQHLNVANPIDRPISFTLEANPYRAALVEYAKARGLLTLERIAPTNLANAPEPMTDPDSKEYRDEDRRVREFRNNEQTITDADLERIFNIRTRPAPIQPTASRSPEMLFGNQLLSSRKVFAFATREGAKGLLKIVEISEDGKPVKTVVRYKLVEQRAPTAKAAPTEELLATKEQVTRIEALLKTVPVTTNYLAELFEATPGVPGEYRFRSDIERLPIRQAEKAPLDFVPLGEVLRRKGGSTYIQWDGLGSSSHHYYGPIHSDIEKLGLKRVPIGAEPK